ncbi:MAG TPA: hypothetical protein VN114_10375 [Oxalicibacterium sp.]|uniref:hypothetical protein n=1 Tax=Oxalicibacterium sp. TaxID=2766525 RepID=UPI002B5F98D0|nr:hypothetical protein [Oxalicibacterium sp.]HWU98908.1 hypothetical protein [Oxalicibacterium sp.]
MDGILELAKSLSLSAQTLADIVFSVLSFSAFGGDLASSLPMFSLLFAVDLVAALPQTSLVVAAGSADLIPAGINSLLFGSCMNRLQDRAEQQYGSDGNLHHDQIPSQDGRTYHSSNRRFNSVMKKAICTMANGTSWNSVEEAYFAGTVASGVGVTPSGVVCMVDPCGFEFVPISEPLCDERDECDFLCFL